MVHVKNTTPMGIIDGPVLRLFAHQVKPYLKRGLTQLPLTRTASPRGPNGAHVWTVKAVLASEVHVCGILNGDSRRQ